MFMYLIEILFRRYLLKFGLNFEYSTMIVDEDLPNFFKAVKLSSAKELILENENMKVNFGFEITDPDTIEGLKLISMPKKLM